MSHMLLRFFMACSLIFTASAAVIDFDATSLVNAAPSARASAGVVGTIALPDSNDFAGVAQSVLQKSGLSETDIDILLEIINNNISINQNINVNQNFNTINIVFGQNGPPPLISTSIGGPGGLGTIQIGSASGTIPPDVVMSQHSMSFDSAAFNVVRVTATSSAFVINNPDPVAAPEPASFILLLGGIATMSAMVRRYRMR